MRRRLRVRLLEPIAALTGYVHGYRTFALSSNVEVVEDVEIGEQSELKKQKLKYRLPLVTSLSLGIDLRMLNGSSSMKDTWPNENSAGAPIATAQPRLSAPLRD